MRYEKILFAIRLYKIECASCQAAYLVPSVTSYRIDCACGAKIDTSFAAKEEFGLFKVSGEYDGISADVEMEEID